MNDQLVFAVNLAARIEQLIDVAKEQMNSLGLLRTEPNATRIRLLTLCCTDLESAANWLIRYCEKEDV